MERNRESVTRKKGVQGPDRENQREGGREGTNKSKVVGAGRRREGRRR